MSGSSRGKTVFQLLLKEKKLTAYRSFAARYAASAAALAAGSGRRSGLRDATVSERQFDRWVGGKVKRPNTDARLILEHMFQIPAERLFEPLTEGGGSSPPQAAVAQCEVRREQPLHDIEEVVMSAAEDSARFAASAESTNVGPTALAQYKADVRRIVATYPSKPIEASLIEARTKCAEVFDILDGRQLPAYRKDLHLIAGQLCAILANASFDLGYYPAAETQARTASLCAELGGDEGLRAWVCGLQALIAYWDGRPLDAIELADSGKKFIPEHGTAHIRLASIKARAYGMMSNATKALEAIHDAGELREALSDDTDNPGGMMAFPLAKERFYASTTHLWLGRNGNLRQAETFAEEAVALFEDAPPAQRRLGELSLARMDLAAARLLRNEVEGAVEQVHTVLAIAHRRPTESVARRLEQFTRRLALHPAATTPLALGLTDAVRSHSASHRARAALLPPGEHA
ncbi:hypothetical protein [Streptomyces luteireticuli]|uniref:hypothetical protein n=1 Tax=Streptomyces luteireticuli TaxID=173858 RepID=UPI003555CE01